MKIDERLALDAITPDDEPHIVVDQDACRRCDVRLCLRVCPANLYSIVEETGEVHVEVAGCLECGTCLVLCPGEALSWRYPAGGAGIRYRFG